MAAKVPQGSDAAFPRRRRRTPTAAVAALVGLVERDFDEARADAASRLRRDRPRRPRRASRPGPLRPARRAPRRRRADRRSPTRERADARRRDRRGHRARSARSPATVDGDGADILEFQIAMLEDDALADAGLRRDRRRAPTPTPPGARRSTPQIADYEAAEDEYFRARAADLARPPRPRAAPSCRRRRATRARRRDRSPARTSRRPASSPSTGVDGRRHRAGRRQPVEPCRHAGARARRADGRRPRRRRARRPRRRRSSTAMPARIVLSPAAGRLVDASTPREPPEPARGAREAAAASHAGRDRRRRRRSRCMINVAEPDELDALDPADLRRHRAGAHRVPVPRRRRPAGRGDAVSRLSPHRSNGPAAGRSSSARSTPAATSRSPG